MSYNPYLPVGPTNPFGPYTTPAVQLTPATSTNPAEEKGEDFIDPSRFADVFLNGRFTPGKFGTNVDLAFGNLDLDDAVDFFRYLASDDGQDELTRSLVSLFVQRGDITVAEAIHILADD